MSRFSVMLAIVSALMSTSAFAANPSSATATGETIVWDNVQDVTLTLPTHSGMPVSNFNYPGGLGVSPYCIHVAINDGNAAAGFDYAGEMEYFFFSMPTADGKYGDGTLINQTYSANWLNASQPSDQVLGSGRQYLGTQANPIAKEGTYSYCFDIPPQSSLIFNITYYENATVAAVYSVTDLILVNIGNGASRSTVVGDPQFVGLRGQSYQVHGMDGAVYNIISEQSTQVNSRFVFLTEGQCPVIAGVKDTNCWSHPGSYLGEMSFQAIVDGKLHAALIQAGSAQTGFSVVQVDGKALTVGELVVYGVFSVEYVSSHLVAVSTAHYAFQLSNSDLFINQALRATSPLSQLQSHGLLGQTHSAKTYANALKYVEGEVDDYVVQDGNIFGTDFLYNKFNKQ